MASTYKIYGATGVDGTYYIDLPVSGRITEVSFSIKLVADAGGVGSIWSELSRSPVTQATVNNPRGVIAMALCATQAASTGRSENHTMFPDEPVKSGERLYLNLSAVANLASLAVNCLVTIA